MFVIISINLILVGQVHGACPETYRRHTNPAGGETRGAGHVPLSLGGVWV